MSRAGRDRDGGILYKYVYNLWWYIEREEQKLEKLYGYNINGDIISNLRTLSYKFREQNETSAEHSWFWNDNQ